MSSGDRTGIGRALLLVAAASSILIVLAFVFVAPSLAAGGLLHPLRRQPRLQPPANCEETTFAGDGVVIRGWRCRASGKRRGTLVYLHGVADNRDSSAGVVHRYTARGLDVVAYDSRAHGASGGNVCTYGYYEKRDLHRIIDSLAPGPIVLVGTSLGAAVALQEAAADSRVSTVIAAETFSDLVTVARERAPAVLPSAVVARAFSVAEQRGRFSVKEVSPLDAARRLRVPVLLIHGEADTLTRPDHSRRVFAALPGPRRLLIVPRAGHNHSLSDPAVWSQIDAWIDDVLEHRLAPVAEPRTTGLNNRNE